VSGKKEKGKTEIATSDYIKVKNLYKPYVDFAGVWVCLLNLQLDFAGYVVPSCSPKRARACQSEQDWFRF